MSTDVALSPVPLEPRSATVRLSTLRRFLRFARSRHWTFKAGIVLFALIALILILGPWIAPYNPAAQSLLRRLSAPSAAHWLGTDHLGRDLLSRILVGGQFSVLIALVTLFLCVTIGTAIGIISARSGGWADEIMMRAVDLLIAFPDVVVAIFAIAILGPGYTTLIISLTIIGWTPFARLSRGLALVISTKEYINAAEVLGCSRTFIIVRHIIPNTLRPIAAITFLRFGHKLITVGGLSFIGLGVQPPRADWALMLAEAQPFVERVPMLVIAPGLAIFLTALSVTWIGQGLELKEKA
ncbi:ABC transporter permease [Bosea vaviloviae]|uniref:ABC transporter permease n=1 Tax=Bosea vaviloviae TaxID=1526658 RepID=A0A1D7U4E9_9HYPH|nr:ABC transporter permease [Bosea vaviloviae]AOO82253.1 ABC transporter permease [Bosea vaviloviae]